MQVLTDEALQHLSRHQYAAGEYSHLDALLNGWWNAAVLALPMWMAPNLVTLLGTLVMASTAAVTQMYVRPCGMRGTALPPWVNFFIAAALFVYQTLDAIDGKQARRTRSSSPLGQLFDHGCDALVSLIVAFNLMSAIGLSPDWRAALLLTTSLLLFFAGQWEEYFTGVLRTSVTKQMGVSEAQAMLMAIHVAAALVSCDAWQMPVEMDTRVAGMIKVRLNHLVSYTIAATVAFSLARYILNVALYRARPQGLVMLLPSAVLAGTTALFFHPVTAPLFSLSDLDSGMPRLLLFTVGLAQTHLTTQMIVFSMAKQPFDVGQVVAWTLPLVALVDAYAPGYAANALSVYLGVVVTSYLVFVISAINEISSHLNISVFVLPAAAKQKAAAAAKTSVMHAAEEVAGGTHAKEERTGAVSGGGLDLSPAAQNGGSEKDGEPKAVLRGRGGGTPGRKGLSAAAVRAASPAARKARRSPSATPGKRAPRSASPGKQRK